jgi:predicted Fe-Mo cluster-binding NifX family protein
MEGFVMRIALVTDDGRTVSRHFGRAVRYAVLTVEEGAIVSREMRDKPSRHGSADGPHEGAGDGHAHGTGPEGPARHAAMFEPVRDCAALVAGGMGRPAYDHAKAAGIRPVVTSLSDIDEAALRCADGTIVDEVERLH